MRNRIREKRLSRCVILYILFCSQAYGITFLAGFNDEDGYTLSYNWRGDGQKGMVSVFAPGDPNDVLYSVDYAYEGSGRMDMVYEPKLGLEGFVADMDYDDNGNREVLSCYPTGEIFGSTKDMAYSYWSL